MYGSVLGRVRELKWDIRCMIQFLGSLRLFDFIQSNPAGCWLILFIQFLHILALWNQRINHLFHCDVQSLVETMEWHPEKVGRRERSYPNTFRSRAHSLSRNMGASMEPTAQAWRQSRTHASYAITACHGPWELNLIYKNGWLISKLNHETRRCWFITITNN